MARTKRNPPVAAPAGPKDRYRRSLRLRQMPVPSGLVAKPPIPKSKHHTYYEFVENKERKKKKLEIQVTNKKNPPPGFEFVPIGNPQLTTACKELSREKDAMIFIVSGSKETGKLAYQVHRIGHHIRQAIVEEARATITNMPHHVVSLPDGNPEPIPESQAVYHAQADAAIRDLFPRIPNTDRRMIIEHAFTKSPNKTEKPVGLSTDISLARRVQLAALAHIRHKHTRYDELLKETSWQNARKVVESLCLDILVKWRGDEETGRDQLDEILREVVVISDSEEDLSEEEDSTDATSVEDSGHARAAAAPFCVDLRMPMPMSMPMPMPASQAPVEILREAGQPIVAAKKAQRGFKRYRAWQEAIRRNHDEEEPALDMNATNRSQWAHPQRPPGSLPAHRPDAWIDPFDQPRYREVPWDNVPRHDIYHQNQVGSVVIDEFPSASRRSRAPSPGSHLQDMLVRSIEPASPVAGPSFVRAVPPRRRSPEERDTYPRTSTTQHGRDPFPGPSLETQQRSVQSSYRDRHHDRPLDHGMPAHPMAYSHDAVHSPQFPEERLSRRIVVNAPRPGVRSNPVLMEDRGGFFERINPHTERPRQYQVIETIETIPTTRDATSQTRASWAGHHANHEVLYSRAGDGSFGGGPPPHAYTENFRPMPPIDYAAPPPEGYWVINRNNDQQARHPGWTHRIPYAEPPPPMDARYERRSYNLRPRHPRDVIYLD